METKWNFTADWNEVSRNQPSAPVSDRDVEISVVHGAKGSGVRCVYVNNYRVVGGKPYVSEGLGSTEKIGKVADVLDAFSDADIRAYLAEKAARQEYFSAYREWRQSNLTPETSGAGGQS